MSKIEVQLEVRDQETLDDLVRLIEIATSYAADNVAITSHYGDAD